MVYYNAHPAWRDIYLQAKKAYGDGIIILGINYYQTDIFYDILDNLFIHGMLKEFPKSPERELVKDIINTNRDEGNFSDLEKMFLTLNISDVKTPTIEISYYDFCLFISFWKVMYDDYDYFTDQELYLTINSQLSRIAESVFDEQYGIMYFNRDNKPYINGTMMYHLFNAFMGFKTTPNVVEHDWSWLQLQWIINKDWPKEETPEEWFSPLWGPVKRKALFMNWDQSPL